MRRHTPLLTSLLLLIPSNLCSQIKVTASDTPLTSPTGLLRPSFRPHLLPAGKTEGTFHLVALVRKDRSVLLRWSNDQGEMPTEGVRVFRQRVGDSSWKDLTGRKPVGFLQGKAAEKALKAMPSESRERLLSYPFGNVQHDPGSRLRLMEIPKDSPRSAYDLSPEKSLQQFRTLRAAGRLNRTDLQLMHVRADMEAGMSDALGLGYLDDPGKGQWLYKIQIGLPEGGSLEVVTPKPINSTVPTPIPQPVSLSATSGNGEVLLNWDETPSEVIAGYNIYRADSPTGNWLKLNADPVKRVELELEDPELTLRRSHGILATMDRMLRPLPAAARTPQRVLEARRQAVEQAGKPGNLPELSPSASKAIRDAVVAGRLRPGGRQAPRSIYTDSIRTAGNALQNEKTYYYKVTAVDLGGLQQPMESAPMAAGIPKDLEPPRVPGRPMLKAEMAARTELHTAQANRLKDPQLAALSQSLATPRNQAMAPLNPFQPNASAAPAPRSSAQTSVEGSLSGDETRKQRLSRTAATMPVAALKKLGDAAVLRSLPDGSVPPAQLTWSPSPDADLKGYEVHRGTGTGAITKIAETAVPEWTDTGLVAGQAYRYAICAVDKLGNVSDRSPEGRLEVSDSSLPGRLAIGQVAGQVAKEAHATTPSRRFLRPADRVLPSGALGGPRAEIQLGKVGDGGITPYVAPKLPSQPRSRGLAVSAAAAKVSPAKGLPLSSDSSSLKATAVITPTLVKVPRSINPMLVAPPPPKEIHVLLEWAKPIQGLPLEYVIQKAPQQMERVSLPRPKVAFQPGIHIFDRGPAPTAMGALKNAGLMSAAARPELQGAPPAPGIIASTAAQHLQASKGLVAYQGGGLSLSAARKDHMASLVPKAGPGTFTRVNETPVAAERFVVAFPAEVAQYGGATFYFRVQAFTKEFGRTVAGPISEPIEVRLPDIVAPPSPAVGAADLRPGLPGRLEVALSWTQLPARDLTGVVVDRQPMAYTLVGGEAKAGSPTGPAERLTPTPIQQLSYLDKTPPAGFQRYTLRSVDATGNLSDALGALDIIIPGEPDPGQPTQLTLAGNRLSWQAAPDALGYTVWRSFSGEEDDFECISGILGATETSFALPPEGTLHLRVLARSSSGMSTTPSQPLVRTP